MRYHLKLYVPDNPAAFAFTGPTGTAIWRDNFNKLVSWRTAVARIGQPELHFHDLRHTGNVLASQTGASLRDLMTRMGHDSPRAALIYQHASQEADRAIAKGVNAAVKRAQTKAKRVSKPDDGAGGVVARVS